MTELRYDERYHDMMESAVMPDVAADAKNSGITKMVMDSSKKGKAKFMYQIPKGISPVTAITKQENVFKESCANNNIDVKEIKTSLIGKRRYKRNRAKMLIKSSHIER